MTGMLGRLFAVAEAYPELKANTNFLQLQDQLASIEGELQSARRYYNATVRDLNSTIQSFPPVVDRAADGLHRGAVLPGRRSGDPKRAESVVRPSGGLTCAALWQAPLPPCCSADAWRRARRRADPPLSQRRPGPEGQLDRSHRDDRCPRRERPDQPRHLPRLPDPLSRSATELNSTSASPSKARPSTGVPVKASVEPVATASGSSSAIPNSYVVRRRARLRPPLSHDARDRPLRRLSTSSTGTRPATAGSSRSTSPRRGSACPQPVQFGQRSVYTGPQGSTASNAEVVDEKPGEITFRTTQPLGPYEGLTVAVAFPKGVVAEPRRAAALSTCARRLRSAALGLLGLHRALRLLLRRVAARRPKSARWHGRADLLAAGRPQSRRHALRDQDGRRQPDLRGGAGRHGRSAVTSGSSRKIAAGFPARRRGSNG